MRAWSAAAGSKYIWKESPKLPGRINPGRQSNRRHKKKGLPERHINAAVLIKRRPHQKTGDHQW